MTACEKYGVKFWIMHDSGQGDEDEYDLPGDWYLQVGTEIQLMIEGTKPVTPTMPLTPELVSKKDSKLEDINVYPIPARDKLFIAGGEISDSYKVFSIQGVLVNEARHTGNTIEVSKLIPGMYLLQLKNTVIRFIKE